MHAIGILVHIEDTKWVVVYVCYHKFSPTQSELYVCDDIILPNSEIIFIGNHENVPLFSPQSNITGFLIYWHFGLGF